MKDQQGLVMVFALLILICITILGVSSVSSSLLQGKMASSIERKSVTFDAAEAAIAGVIFESVDESILSDITLTDPFTEARKLGQIDLENEKLSCFDTNRIDRAVTTNGLSFKTRHTTQGHYNKFPVIKSWSKTAFIREQACLGSSAVISGTNINCHLFIVRGCGQMQGSNYVIANTLTVAVIAAASH